MSNIITFENDKKVENYCGTSLDEYPAEKITKDGETYYVDINNNIYDEELNPVGLYYNEEFIFFKDYNQNSS